MEFVSCGVCGIEKKELYTCPKCIFRYCSIKCYRNEKHSACSEKFYQEQVKQELSGKKFDSAGTSGEHKEKLEKFLKGDWSGIEEGEPLDSDDEEPGTSSAFKQEEDDAMRKIVESTIEKYDIDDGELERQLIGVGLSDDVDELLNALTPEERLAFKQLAEEMQQEEEGLGQSCFGSK